MIPPLPLTGERFRLRLGVRALGRAPLIVVDPERHAREVALRRRLLSEDHAYRYRGGAATLAAQWEVVELLLGDLARHHPRHGMLEAEGDRRIWIDRLLGERTAFTLGDPASLPQEPLDWIGRRVVEDLLLLTDGPGWPLAAGQLCFPNDWCLPDKLGRPLLAVHAPVPGFAGTLGPDSLSLLDRLRPERPVWRANWAIRATDALDLSPRARAPAGAEVTADTAGEALFVRVERQTLSRLPRSGAVLFTIHTRSRSLTEAIEDSSAAARLLGTIRSMPVEMAGYKGLAPFRDALCAYLERRAGGVERRGPSRG
jgi:hypothetical protein